MQIVAGSIIFAVLGYLFSTHEFTSKQKVLVYTLAIVVVLLRYFGTLYLSKESGTLNQTFWGDINQVPLACGVFLFFKNNKFIASTWSKEKPAKVLKKLSSCSLGIYLCHYIVYSILSKYIVLHPIVEGILFPFMVYVVSLVIVLILKKIPVVKYSVP